MSITGQPDGHPLKPGTALADMLTGLYATIGTLAALQARERSGIGQHVEVSLIDSALASLLNLGSSFLNTGAVPGRSGNRHPSIAPYETFAAADRDLALAGGNDAIFERLCGVLGRPELAADPRFATNAQRVGHREQLGAELEAAFAGDTAEAWAERLNAAGVPAGPVNDVGEAFRLAERLGLEPVTELDGVRTARSPLRLAGTPAPDGRRPPRLGEHDDELRAWLSRPARPGPGESTSGA
jgi:crotonobetainyl-CoA:carnitine CoA-transferase CaiB-like acyl-CoA transferase